jgi:integrase
MRAGEIFNLTWDRVNMKDGCFTLTPKDTKTGEARYVYFNRTGMEILVRLRKVRQITHKFVFTYQGNPVRSIKSCLTRGLERAGIEDFRFHDLRHTFVSNARKAGVDRTVIMKLTGHKTLSMFTRYNTVDQADAREAVNRLDDFLAGGGNPTAAIVLQE